MPVRRRRARPAAAKGRAKVVPGRLTAEMFAGDPLVDDRFLVAFEHAVTRFAHRPEVTGVDIGYRMKAGKHTKRLAIRIHVREKFAPRHLDARTRFPKDIDGVPIDVIGATYVHHSGGGPAVAGGPADALRPGLSVGLPSGPVGTLGVIALDPATEAGCLVSAAHVLAAGDETRPGDPVIQPGREDGGRAPRDVVGALERIDFANDAAYAVVTSARPVDAQPVGASVRIRGTRFPRRDDVLEKSGRSTHVTQARVDGIGHFFGVLFGIHLVPLEGQTAPIAAEGDSGAVWYDPASGKAVGIHCKGSPHPVGAANYAVACSIKKVVDAWGLVV